MAASITPRSFSTLHRSLEQMTGSLLLSWIGSNVHIWKNASRLSLICWQRFIRVPRWKARLRLLNINNDSAPMDILSTRTPKTFPFRLNNLPRDYSSVNYMASISGISRCFSHCSHTLLGVRSRSSPSHMLDLWQRTSVAYLRFVFKQIHLHVLHKSAW